MTMAFKDTVQGAIEGAKIGRKDQEVTRVHDSKVFDEQQHHTLQLKALNNTQRVSQQELIRRWQLESSVLREDLHNRAVCDQREADTLSAELGARKRQGPMQARQVTLITRIRQLSSGEE